MTLQVPGGEVITEFLLSNKHDCSVLFSHPSSLENKISIGLDIYNYAKLGHSK